MRISSLPFSVGPYIAPSWLKGGNAQTIYPYLLSRPFIPYRRERWELDDGDFIDIDWLDNATMRRWSCCSTGWKGAHAVITY